MRVSRNFPLPLMFAILGGACASTSNAGDDPDPPPPYTDPWEGTPQPGIEEDPTEQPPEPDPDAPVEVEPEPLPEPEPAQFSPSPH